MSARKAGSASAARDTVIVAGLGRCGSTMICSMLHAGGMPMADPPPDYEGDVASAAMPPGVGYDQHSLVQALELASGRAFKVLGPHLASWQGTDARVIWCDRDRREQAKSQRKLAAHAIGDGGPGWRAWAELIDVDRAEGLRRIRAVGLPLVQLSYEAVLEKPAEAAATLSGFVERPLDVAAMAAAVHRRSYRCATGLDFEIANGATRRAR